MHPRNLLRATVPRNTGPPPSPETPTTYLSSKVRSHTLTISIIFHENSEIFFFFTINCENLKSTLLLLGPYDPDYVLCVALEVEGNIQMLGVLLRRCEVGPEEGRVLEAGPKALQQLLRDPHRVSLLILNNHSPCQVT